MKAEAWIFGITALFVAVVTPGYWFLAEDPTGTSALVMTALLFGMVTLYLGFHASRMDPRPEDRKEGDIAEGAGELGFFPPYSWWPLWLTSAHAPPFADRNTARPGRQMQSRSPCDGTRTRRGVLVRGRSAILSTVSIEFETWALGAIPSTLSTESKTSSTSSSRDT